MQGEMSAKMLCAIRALCSNLGKYRACLLAEYQIKTILIKQEETA